MTDFRQSSGQEGWADQRWWSDLARIQQNDLTPGNASRRQLCRLAFPIQKWVMGDVDLGNSRAEGSDKEE